MAKKNSNNWLMWIVLVIALVALVLGAVALNKTNMTGNAFWELFKKTNNVESGKGLLGNVYLSNNGNVENLKEYEVKYDEEGNLMYEILEGHQIIPGEGYSLIEDENGILRVSAVQGGSSSSSFGWDCSCNSADGCSGSKDGCKRISLGGSGGTDCVKKPDSTKCSAEGCKCKERWSW